MKQVLIWLKWKVTNVFDKVYVVHYIWQISKMVSISVHNFCFWHYKVFIHLISKYRRRKKSWLIWLKISRQMIQLQQWITEHLWQCIAGSLAKKRYYRACTDTWDCSDRQQKLWSNWRWNSAGHLDVQKSPTDIVLCTICGSEFSFHHSTSSLQYHINTKPAHHAPSKPSSIHWIIQGLSQARENVIGGIICL